MCACKFVVLCWFSSNRECASDLTVRNDICTHSVTPPYAARHTTQDSSLFRSNRHRICMKGLLRSRVKLTHIILIFVTSMEVIYVWSVDAVLCIKKEERMKKLRTSTETMGVNWSRRYMHSLISAGLASIIPTS
jgi:hypothetical protein